MSKREPELEDVAVLLALSLDPATPHPRVKERLMRAIAPKHEEHGLGAMRADAGVWKPGDAPGITYKKLYFDRPSGLLTMLVRMEPGSVYPAHRHMRTEQCLILEGDLIHDDHVYGPGDFTWAEAGSLDPELRTVNGNLLLIIGAPGTQRASL